MKEDIVRRIQKAEDEAVRGIEEALEKWMCRTGIHSEDSEAGHEIAECISAYEKERTCIAESAAQIMKDENESRRALILEMLAPCGQENADAIDRLLSTVCGETSESRLSWRKLAACRKYITGGDIRTLAAAFYSVEPYRFMIDACQKMTKDCRHPEMYRAAVQVLMNREIAREFRCVKETKEYIADRKGFIPLDDVPEWFRRLSYQDVYSMRLIRALIGNEAFAKTAANGCVVQMNTEMNLRQPCSAKSLKSISMKTETGAFIASALRKVLYIGSPECISIIRNASAYERLLVLFATGMAADGSKRESDICGYDSEEIRRILSDLD